MSNTDKKNEKLDKRAAALRENLKKRKALAKQAAQNKNKQDNSDSE